MRQWKLGLGTFVACVATIAFGCSDEEQSSRMDESSTGGRTEGGDGDRPRGVVRDLSDNCEGLRIEQGVSCKRTGLFCFDENMRGCICGGLAQSDVPDGAAPDGGGRRGTADDRDETTEPLLWECLGGGPRMGDSGGAPGSGGFFGGAPGSSGGVDNSPGLGGAR